MAVVSAVSSADEALGASRTTDAAVSSSVIIVCVGLFIRSVELPPGIPGYAEATARCNRKYTGELRLRMPPSLHRRLALEAAEQNRSLNRVIIDKLVGA